MANGPEIARAYVQIVPSMQGAQGTISKELGAAAQTSGNEAGEKSGNAFVSAMGKVVKVGAAAITAAAAGITKVVKDAISAYGDFEQLSGGIETLFGDSANKVMENADKAFKTAGLSANEYMETAIQSSAAMINSLNGDTQKAAEMTDMAITDMADNVNKMGTSMESIQNAYRGFSRGNFSMLDNLALGFSGSKEGMEQLLDKAKEISGFEYDISSYSDIVEAIHVVQTEMGITGTTQKEAEKTIQGSLNALKSSWKNLLTGLGNENANIGEKVNELLTSFTNVADNIGPVVERILEGISEAAESFGGMLGDLVTDILKKVPNLIKAATKMVKGLITGIRNGIPDLKETIPDIIAALVDAISELLPLLISTGMDIIIALAEGLVDAIPDLIKQIPVIITDMVNAFTERLGDLGAVAGEMIGALVVGLIEGIPQLIAAIPEIIGSLALGLLQGFEGLLTGLFGELFGYAEQYDEQATQVWVGQTQAIRDMAAAAEEAIEAAHAMNEKRQESMTKIEGEIGLLEDVRKKLDKYVDSTGKIKEGYEDEVAALVLLAEKQGVHIEVIDDEIQNIDDLKQSIDELIEKRKADAIVAAETSLYEEAYKRRKETDRDYREHYENYLDAMYKADEARKLGLEEDAAAWDLTAEDEKQVMHRLQEAWLTDTSEMELSTYNMSQAVQGNFNSLATTYDQAGLEVDNFKLDLLRENQDIQRDYEQTYGVKLPTAVTNATSQMMGRIGIEIDRRNGNIATQMGGVGTNAVNSLGNAFITETNSNSATMNKVKSAMLRITWMARKTLGIHSPSKVFKDIGLNVDAGLQLGIEDGVPDVLKSMEDMNAELVATANIKPSTLQEIEVDDSRRQIEALTFNVYGAEGQDEETLAELILEKLDNIVAVKEAVYA